MDTYHQAQRVLPDVVASPLNIPPPSGYQTSMTGCFPQKQQVHSHGQITVCQEQGLQTVLPAEDGVIQMMMDCSMGTPSECSSGIHSIQPTPCPPNTTMTLEYTPQHPSCSLPPPPPSPPQHIQIGQPVAHQPPQLPDIDPEKVVEEFERIMKNENDKVVLINSVCLLFRFSIDSVRGLEVCRAMSASPDIMNRLYYVLLDKQFENDDLILCYATGNLTNISKFEEGRAALLGYDSTHQYNRYGVDSLINSLRSRDSNVIIFAITAIHNLLLDRRIEIQEVAKSQIKFGLASIVQLLDNKSLIHNYEFKVIVLDCLQILAYGNRENRLTIKDSRGPHLLLRTIEENFDNQPTEELVETASRVLKSLSACPANKVDIIENGGINILTNCIKRNNHEILKTCLWTLRNLSDMINNREQSIKPLVVRLLHILDEYSEEPCIITCALGILANLTCNNEAIKQLICEHKGIELILNTVAFALKDERDFRVVDKEILEPAICALCHLMNQTHYPNLADEAKRSIMHNFDLFKALISPNRVVSDDLSKAVEKLTNLTFKS